MRMFEPETNISSILVYRFLHFIGLAFPSRATTHNHQHTNTMGKSEQGDTNCVDGDEIDNNWPNAKSSLSNDRNGKTITMNEMTK